MAREVMNATQTHAQPVSTPAPPAASNSQLTTTARLRVEGMHCASCVAKVERELCEVPGVEDALVNLATTEATVRYLPGATDVGDLERAIERAGYKLRPPGSEEEEEEEEGSREEREREREYSALMRKFWFAAAISVPVLVLSYPDLLGLDRFSFFAKGSDTLWWTWRALGVLTLPVLVWAGAQFYEGAWRG